MTSVSDGLANSQVTIKKDILTCENDNLTQRWWYSVFYYTATTLSYNRVTVDTLYIVRLETWGRRFIRLYTIITVSRMKHILFRNGCVCNPAFSHVDTVREGWIINTFKRYTRICMTYISKHTQTIFLYYSVQISLIRNNVENMSSTKLFN